MRKHTCCNHRVISLEDLNDIFNRLTGIKANLFTTGVDGVAAELNNGHLH